MRQQTFQQNPTVLNSLAKVRYRNAALRYSTNFVVSFAILLLAGAAAVAQQAAANGDAGVNDSAPMGGMMGPLLEGVKQAERAQYLYERIERVESRKEAGEKNPLSVKVFRVIPAGTGMAKIPIGTDGKPADESAYRAELDKLLKSLLWAAESGQPQREAYQKIQKKQKDRDELIDATRNGFIFTEVGQEMRGERTLTKYRMQPNPAYKSTSRSTSLYSRVRGLVWVDNESHQLARVEGEVTDDISLGVFLAKIYKGSHFMQDRYEMVPGMWLPSFSQYDFDGRKLFSSFSVHEKTFYSNYRRVGPPAEAIPQIQAEIARLDAEKANSGVNR